MCDDGECIICFTDTSSNDYLELDCCKQIIHIECLNTWIQTNIKNTDENKKCFHCKQENDYINTIIYYSRLEEDNNRNCEPNNDSLFVEDNTNNSNSSSSLSSSSSSSLSSIFILSFIIIGVFTTFKIIQDDC